MTLVRMIGKVGIEMPSSMLQSGIEKLKQLGVCTCICHIDGNSIMHVRPCCKYTYRKYIHIDGTFDTQIVNEILVKNFQESIGLSNKLSLENEEIIHPMGHAND